VDQPRTERTVARFAYREARYWALEAAPRQLRRAIADAERDHDQLDTAGLARLKALRDTRDGRT